MSYDLYFAANSGSAGPTIEDQRTYFEGRTSYEVSDVQAWYGNEDTGVYFCFDIGRQPLDEEEGEAAEAADANRFGSIASFNLNYFRPHYFALEAAPEVEAFAKHFDLLIDDPQLDGMGRGRFTAEGFLKGWNKGNAFAYRAMTQSQTEQRPLLMSTARLESIWRWNFDRARFQAQLGEESVFVPKVMFLSVDDEPKTFCAWADGIPVMLPEVDYVFLPRQELAPRRFFTKREDIAVVSWSELEPLLSSFDSVAGALRYHKLNYTTVPRELQSFIKELPASTTEYNGVGNDTVLNAEIMADAIRSGGG